MANGIFNVGADIKQIPKFAQTQESLESQLFTLSIVANRLGLYDAADHIKKVK